MVRGVTPQVDAVEMLRAAGLRVTGARLAALDALAGGGHLSADEVVTEVRERLGAVSTQAGYDVLRALAAAGLARRVEPAGSPARYEARAGDNHHHVVCRSCGAIADVDCAVGDGTAIRPVPTYGGLRMTDARSPPDHSPRPSRLRQPEPAHGRLSRAGDDGELPLPGEGQPLRPGADPRAGGARPRLRRPRLLRGLRHHR